MVKEAEACDVAKEAEPYDVVHSPPASHLGPAPTPRARLILVMLRGRGLVWWGAQMQASMKAMTACKRWLWLQHFQLQAPRRQEAPPA